MLILSMRFLSVFVNFILFQFFILFSYYNYFTRVGFEPTITALQRTCLNHYTTVVPVDSKVELKNIGEKRQQYSKRIITRYCLLYPNMW